MPMKMKIAICISWGTETKERIWEKLLLEEGLTKCVTMYRLCGGAVRIFWKLCTAFVHTHTQGADSLPVLDLAKALKLPVLDGNFREEAYSRVLSPQAYNQNVYAES